MKEKILDTATDLFLTLGFKSVTMDDLADRMGISKKTIYTHFKNKIPNPIIIIKKMVKAQELALL